MVVDVTYKLPDGFKTSINVLNKVLNISCSTIEHELKKHNFLFYDQSSNCIDEKMLDIFAEKFCKNLKRYFAKTLQEFETLSLEESRQFHEFARTYSKHGRFTKKWREIDKGTIKDDFLRQIVELTTREKCTKIKISDSLKDAYLQLIESTICDRKQEVHPINKVEFSSLESQIESTICRCNNRSLRVLDAVDSSLLNAISQGHKHDLSYYLDYNEIGSKQDSIFRFISKKQDGYHNRLILVEKIKRSRLYHSRRARKSPTYKFVPLFERIYVFARFHIVSDDGTEDEIYFRNSLRG
ncbi:MAG: hypothetical protein HDS11_05880 [Bacteroides sp.]|nr:hypothetical protein [Bacteroides sp.]